MFHVLSSHQDPRDPHKCQLELCSRWSCAIWPCGQCHLATRVLLLLCPIPNSAFKPTGFLHPHSSSHFSFWLSADNSPYMSSSKCVSGHTWKDHMAVFFFLNSYHPQTHFASYCQPSSSSTVWQQFFLPQPPTIMKYKHWMMSPCIHSC